MKPTVIIRHPEAYGLPPVETPPAPPVKPGLGDRVHAVLHPIARAIDYVAKTDLANCPDCKDRREWLNRLGKSRPQK